MGGVACPGASILGIPFDGGQIDRKATAKKTPAMGSLSRTFVDDRQKAEQKQLLSTTSPASSIAKY